MSSDGNTFQTAGAIERPSRRDLLYERRQSILQQKSTESLPRINGDTSHGKSPARQLAQLREENKRLRAELQEQRQLLKEAKLASAEYDKEIEAIHSGYQQEIEQYQNHLRDMMEERNVMQDTQQQLEQRYQELYSSFQDAVEEEAHKMVAEAAQTLVLTPEHTPVLFRDVAKTLELQVKQVEDQHIAEALYLIRQAQAKAQQLEQQLNQERLQLAAERQNLIALQNNTREQAKLRYKTLRDHLEASFTAKLTAMVMALVLLLLVLQMLLLPLFGVHLALATIIALCVPIPLILAGELILSRLHINVGSHFANRAHTHKTADKKES